MLPRGAMNFLVKRGKVPTTLNWDERLRRACTEDRASSLTRMRPAAVLGDVAIKCHDHFTEPSPSGVNLSTDALLITAPLSRKQIFRSTEIQFFSDHTENLSVDTRGKSGRVYFSFFFLACFADLIKFIQKM